MALRIGDPVPDISLNGWTDGGPKPLSRATLFGAQRVALFAVPGAFTPTCTDDHLPSILRHADQIRHAGIDWIACIAVNDIFVLRAWARSLDTGDEITMLADGSAAWTRAAGFDWDLGDLGLGVRSQRYAMIVEDACVTHLAIEKGAAFDVSGGQNILSVLQAREQG